MVVAIYLLTGTILQVGRVCHVFPRGRKGNKRIFSFGSRPIFTSRRRGTTLGLAGDHVHQQVHHTIGVASMALMASNPALNKRWRRGFSKVPKNAKKMLAPFSHSYMEKKTTKFKKRLSGITQRCAKKTKTPQAPFNMEPDKGP